MGSLYLLVAYEAGVDGTLFSMLVRTELALPFVSRVYNVLITAHANPAVIRESHREVQQGERAPRE